jgi:O-antigen/teichoic acid export membrane protein
MNTDLFVHLLDGYGIWGFLLGAVVLLGVLVVKRGIKLSLEIPGGKQRRR